MKAHIDAGSFEEAETVARQLIDRIDPEDHLRFWIEFVQLAGILNMLGRSEEGTEMYRRAFAEAQQLPSPQKELGAARYMLGNQYLLFGDPRDALEVVEPIPSGGGHIQCLLHAVAAKALWKLERHNEARAAAERAINASPTAERRTELSEQLEHILGRA